MDCLWVGAPLALSLQSHAGSILRAQRPSAPHGLARLAGASPEPRTKIHRRASQPVAALRLPIGAQDFCRVGRDGRRRRSASGAAPARLEARAHCKSDAAHYCGPALSTRSPERSASTPRSKGLSLRSRALRPHLPPPTSACHAVPALTDALSARLLGRPLAGCDGAPVCALSGVLSCCGGPSAAGRPLPVCVGQNRLSGEVSPCSRLPHVLHAGPFAFLSVCT